MKTLKYPKFLLGILPLVIMILLAPADVMAKKRYSIDQVAIEAQLNNDGTMNIKNSRTFNFRGSYKYAYLELLPGENSDYSNFRIAEDGRNYQKNDSEEPGTYWVKPINDGYEVRWFFRARSETRTFDISYKANGVVVRHPDAAVVYHTFIGDKFRKASRNVQLTIRPPRSENSPGQVLHWLHGPLHAKSTINSDGTIIATCNVLPRKTHLTVRAIYPPDLFPLATTANDLVAETIKREEADFAVQANEERQNRATREVAREKHHGWGIRIVAPVMALLIIAGYVVLFRRYGTRPTLPPAPSIVGSPPADTAPALVGYMVNERAITGTDLVGTLMDLASRGFLTLVEKQITKKPTFGKEKTEATHSWRLNREYLDSHRQTLRPFEVELIDFIFVEIGENQDEVELETFKKKSSDFQKFIANWKKNIKAEAEARNMYNQNSLKGAVNVGWFNAGALVVSAVPAFYFGPAMLIPVGVALICGILAFAVPHLNKESAIEARNWKLFKKYLSKKRFLSGNNKDVLQDINRFVVYGTILGVNQKAFTSLLEIIPANQAAVILPWYLGTHHIHSAATMGDFSTALSAAITSTTTTMSSAAGLGGGASAGGAGASGGGGGGAG